ncbi:MAG TPA: class I SAM-dependent methyltransferase [Solirubrobacteraceae bacterium]|jgi:predicted O-methyltransferase YrrM
MTGAPAGVEGWLTDAQADRLAAAARRLGPGARVVEIGSFRGRSTIVLAGAAPADAEVVAIDPHLGSDRGPQEIAAQPELGEADAAAFRANLERFGVARRVRHVRALSHEALGAVDGAVDLLYVDGAHRYGPARADLREWGGRVRAGGALLVHDAFSSVGVTLALLRGVVFARDWRYRGRAGSLAEYARAPVSGRARARNAAVQLGQLPWFARNLVVKLLIVARLRSGPWPY